MKGAPTGTQFVAVMYDPIDSTAHSRQTNPGWIGTESNVFAGRSIEEVLAGIEKHLDEQGISIEDADCEHIMVFNLHKHTVAEYKLQEKPELVSIPTAPVGNWTPIPE